MTYVLQPFEDYLAKLPEELNNLLKAEYDQRLAEVNYDLPKLFDLVTNVCEDYFDPTLLGALIKKTIKLNSLLLLAYVLNFLYILERYC